MRKIFLLFLAAVLSLSVTAEMTPLFYEGFTRCIDEEDENYGYTGGNDNRWGGDVATAIVVYQDAPEWTLDYCNGGLQCLKVGTSSKQGKATTPFIPCEGEAVLSFRAAPWEGDSIMTVSISGGNTQDPTAFNLKKHQWTDITIRISDITSGIKVTFSSYYKHRFFLDEVYVRPQDPTVGVIRVPDGTTVDFGLVGCNYKADSRIVRVEGVNLKGNISVKLEGGNASQGVFDLSTASLPAAGGSLTVTTRPGAASGSMFGTTLMLQGKDAKTNETVLKKVSLMMEVSSLNLEGAGTKPDPYTCGDVLLLAANEGTVWNDTYYWVTGYVLGGVKRYQEQYDGISYTDNLSLVLAADPAETNDSKYVLVQITGNARAALNVVDNPELIGQQIKVNGLLLNDNLNPNYLGKPGVRDVRTDAQYVRPAKPGLEGIEEVFGEGHAGTRKILYDGQLYLLRGETLYTITGQLIHNGSN